MYSQTDTDRRIQTDQALAQQQNLIYLCARYACLLQSHK